ncbi:hypothetical protein [Lentzea kentuckyensis]|uniref:hypothetical protein n=1 Tax=Lentzea kentuckyensis TaxID=360086 RepID=UPI00117B7A5D|nr:hypothetical protein [Lentzea kentuckyensis]
MANLRLVMKKLPTLARIVIDPHRVNHGVTLRKELSGKLNGWPKCFAVDRSYILDSSSSRPERLSRLGQDGESVAAVLYRANAGKDKFQITSRDRHAPDGRKDVLWQSIH